jgi:hypothetical protein
VCCHIHRCKQTYFVIYVKENVTVVATPFFIDVVMIFVDIISQLLSYIFPGIETDAATDLVTGIFFLSIVTLYHTFSQTLSH